MTDGFLHRRFPDQLKDLPELANDLRWSTSLITRGIWQRLAPEEWQRTENPYLVLLNTAEEQLTAASADTTLLRELSWWQQKAKKYYSDPTWFDTCHANKSAQIAYFSMEFGLSEALPIYSGGLGMLAGDHLKSASDLGVPLTGIGLLYQQGYFRQVLAADGMQCEAYPYNDPGSLPVTPLIHNGGWVRVPLELPGRTLFLRVWQAKVGRVTLYLLDSNDPSNSPWDRGITAHLYDAGRDKRLLQEIVLGVGGWRLMDQLALPVSVCHLNEGHAAFAVLARAESVAQRTGLPIHTAFRATRAGNVFTTHTPVSAAFDKFDPEMVCHYARPFIESLALPVDRLLALGRANPADHHEPFNMAFLAMRGCCHVNAVSELHGKVSRGLFTQLYQQWPGTEIPVTSITNGVHIPTWNSAPARRVWMEASGDEGWFTDMASIAASLQTVSPEKLWDMRANARRSLVDYVRRRLTHQLQTIGADKDAIENAQHVLDPNILTLGFARRFTEYKRPNLLISDPERLKRILLDPTHPAQLIVAGKAHPNDDNGKQMVRAMAQFAMHPELSRRVVFLEDYDMVLARHFAAGIDVWLNTPRRPAEACGTSGMKMVFNGGLNLSVRDGWWDEAWTPDVGWQIGDGLEDGPNERDQREGWQMLNMLQNDVAPEFYDRDEHGLPQRWLRRIQSSMIHLSARFSSDRMVKDYVEQAYLPAASALARRMANNGSLATELSNWHSHLNQNWHALHFGDLHITQSDNQWRFVLPVYFGELDPGSIRVELFAEATSDEKDSATVMPMTCGEKLTGSLNGFLFSADVPADRPAEHFTPRAIPWHTDAFVPSEESLILWHH